MQAKFIQILIFVVITLVSNEGLSQPLTQQGWQAKLLEDVRLLSANEMQGRKPATTGHQLAQDYIKQRFVELKLKPFAQYQNYEQAFTFGAKSTPAKNLLGYIQGSAFRDQFFVITAHYDHLGQRGSKVYNGANDNASGVATMLSLLSHFTDHPPAYSILFLATDAEEAGLWGAKYFVEHSPVSLEQLKLNINVDMIGDSGRREVLYLLPAPKRSSFTQVLPDLTHFSEGLPLDLKWRRNRSFLRSVSSTRVNWRDASDHSAFGRKKIPYLYFGADPNREYHTTKDNFAALNQDFFIASVSAIIKIVDYLQQLTPDKLPKHD